MLADSFKKTDKNLKQLKFICIMIRLKAAAQVKNKIVTALTFSPIIVWRPQVDKRKEWAQLVSFFMSCSPDSMSTREKSSYRIWLPDPDKGEKEKSKTFYAWIGLVAITLAGIWLHIWFGAGYGSNSHNERSGQWKGTEGPSPSLLLIYQVPCSRSWDNQTWHHELKPLLAI
jgi:hypothetical protein